MLLHTKGKNKMINIYTDSKYTYNIIHFNSQNCKGWDFLTTKGTPVTNEKHVIAFLQVATLP
jgi:ribonuclease HI